MNKKWMLTAGLTLTLVTGFSLGAYADGLVKKISAYQNGNIKIKVDGNSVNLVDGGDRLIPIVYDGHTYVPAKPVAEALGAKIKWNGSTSTIDLLTGANGTDTGATPNKDNTATTVKGAANTYPSTTKSADLFESFKPTAKDALKLYMDAIKSGDKTKLNAFIEKSDLAVDGYENEAANDVKKAGKNVDGIRLSDQEVIDGLYTGIMDQLNNDRWYKYSQHSQTNGRMYLEYVVKADDYSKLISASFTFVVDSKSNKYHLKSIYFY
ncbi:stalk domain-containing protein [Paenibacillus terrigena]|uniref:stalk domain-containing protein n=1 Tax=Paenibacillus terrigena TaxID=369333 RepID=UPI0028D80D38|nr:stalk domain-containing protein [Paenibacillus terrigena]